MRPAKSQICRRRFTPATEATSSTSMGSVSCSASRRSRSACRSMISSGARPRLLATSLSTSGSLQDLRVFAGIRVEPPAEPQRVVDVLPAFDRARLVALAELDAGERAYLCRAESRVVSEGAQQRCYMERF